MSGRYLRGQATIWLLALGYFIFYAPYSALTKSLSSGTLIETHDAVSGFVILPAIVIIPRSGFRTVMSMALTFGRIEARGESFISVS